MAQKSGDELYSRWSNMMRRCYDPRCRSYKDYGGRGIKVCDRWHTPSNYYEDMGAIPNDLLMDRIDNDGDYTPDNIRLSTPKISANNTRRNHRLTIDGETKTIAEWSELENVPQARVQARVKKLGWDHEEALRKPPAKSVLSEHERALEKSGLNRATAYNRVTRHGWDIEKALTTPPIKRDIEVNGEVKSLCEVARDHGLDRMTLDGRLKRGWSLERALTEDIHRMPIEYKGETKSITEWTEELGIPFTTAYMRIKRGWNVEKAFETPVVSKKRDPVTLTLSGRTLTAKEWAERTGIKYKTILDRRASGWSVERILGYDIPQYTEEDYDKN